MPTQRITIAFFIACLLLAQPIAAKPAARAEQTSLQFAQYMPLVLNNAKPWLESPIPNATVTPSPTNTATAINTAIATATPSPTATATKQATITPSPTNTATATATSSPTASVTPAQPTPSETAMATASPTVTATATPSPTDTATATPSPTASATQEPGPTTNISGSVALNPRWATTQIDPSQPVAYHILLDVTASMSWDFNGHTTYGGTTQLEQDTIGGTDYQCDPIRHPTDPMPMKLTCGAQPWRSYQERRITVTKQALAFPDGFIDQLGANDTMSITAFNNSAITTSTWSSDKLVLKTTVMNAGKYANDRYRTNYGDALVKVITTAHQIRAVQPPTAPDGQTYRQVTILVTDSIAYTFQGRPPSQNGAINYALDVCPEFNGDSRALETAHCQYDQLGYPANPNGRRPLSELVYQAGILKTMFSDMQLYVVGLASVNPLGLNEVASSPTMFYQAPTAADFLAALAAIHSQVMPSTCMPAGGDQWLDHIDATHTADSPPFNLPSGTYGTMYLYRDGENTPFASAPITQDSNGKLTFSAAGLVPGTYHTQAYVAYKGDDQVSRQYDWMIDPNTLQGAASSTFQIAAGDAGANVALAPTLLDLRPESSVCP